MGAIKKFLIVSVVLTILGAYWLYVPIPDGYSQSCSRQLQITLGSMKVVFGLANLGELFGFGSFLLNVRSMSNYMVKQQMKEIPDPEVKEVDYDFNGVPVRVYEPAGRSGILPGFVWYHGGGFVLGSIAQYNLIARMFSKRANVVVVSVDYRLAPEHLFPAGFEDCVKATKYFIQNAAKFNADPSRIAIGGDSAGGNLAATVALKLRDDFFQPSVKLQVLVYPVIQGLDFMLPSMIQNSNGPLLTRAMMANFIQLYIDGKSDKVDVLLANGHVSPQVKKMGFPFMNVSTLPEKYLVGYQKPDVESGNETLWNEWREKLLNAYFCPLFAPRLDNLPPAYVFSAEYDPLRDESLFYVNRLRESGVHVTHRHSDIGLHGIVGFAPVCPEADAMLNEMALFIADNV